MFQKISFFLDKDKIKCYYNKKFKEEFYMKEVAISNLVLALLSLLLYNIEIICRTKISYANI